MAVWMETMNDKIMGPEESFLEMYIEYHFRKGKRLQKEARNNGVTIDELAKMFKKSPEHIEFELNLLGDK